MSSTVHCRRAFFSFSHLNVFLAFLRVVCNVTEAWTSGLSDHWLGCLTTRPGKAVKTHTCQQTPQGIQPGGSCWWVHMDTHVMRETSDPKGAPLSALFTHAGYWSGSSRRERAEGDRIRRSYFLALWWQMKVKADNILCWLVVVRPNIPLSSATETFSMVYLLSLAHSIGSFIFSMFLFERGQLFVKCCIALFFFASVPLASCCHRHQFKPSFCSVSGTPEICWYRRFSYHYSGTSLSFLNRQHWCYTRKQPWMNLNLRTLYFVFERLHQKTAHAEWHCVVFWNRNSPLKTCIFPVHLIFNIIYNKILNWHFIN